MARRGTGRGQRGSRKRPAGSARYLKATALLAALAILLMAGYWAYRTQSFEGIRSILPSRPAEAPPGGGINVRVFFANSEFDPQGMECSRVYPVSRVVERTEAVARAALEELLRGPNDQEKARGYFTSLSADVRMRDVQISQGVAHVDFGPELGSDLAGSCQVESAGSQIRQTLLQFPTVRSVRITIENRDSSPLQP